MIPVAPIKQIILRAGPLGVADYGPPRCHPSWKGLPAESFLILIIDCFPRGNIPRIDYCLLISVHSMRNHPSYRLLMGLASALNHSFVSMTDGIAFRAEKPSGSKLADPRMSWAIRLTSWA